MLFNSVEFALFLPIVFTIYWLINNKNLAVQNTLLLFASYFFYAWWDWRFLFLIVFSSMVDYLVGIKLLKENDRRKRKVLLLISVFVNISFLFFFKYFNFFSESFAKAFTIFGSSIEVSRLNLILPVGISFYTFQTLSYTIDVYKRRIKPTKDPIAFFTFVSFFPQLVAGPIERASNLLPQFYKKRTFEYHKMVDGMRQILWGLLKKIVIADNCAIYANEIFGNYESYSGSVLLMGAVFFTFQIYGDFSGYSDIAIGTSRLFGIRLKQNFAFPYFSRNMAEFWKRWHISLSTWFRDYVYIPLGGSYKNKLNQVRNVFIVFLLSGFWHGANWTFIFWGAINACWFLPTILFKRKKKSPDIIAVGKLFPSIREFFQMIITFFLIVLSWIFFRAETIGDAVNYVGKIFSSSILTFPNILTVSMLINILVIFLFVVVEWFKRNKLHGLDFKKSKKRKPLRWSIYYIVILMIYFFGNFQNNIEFIYFQF
ncbi:MBOAT family protein [Aquimarina sp. I32.4]|uniref:MBOAT family O-acyltransferase n=1 Tax=Aquimarina sp. I32.4 TaxID=2053903 RepID=UPI000CDE675D|nr:MBOAT family O-acyltransferase [Aquimarina sp. I32.4]